MWQNLMHGQCRWGFLAVVLFKRSAVCGADFSDPFQRFHAEEVEALTHDIACGQAKGKARAKTVQGAASRTSESPTTSGCLSP